MFQCRLLRLAVSLFPQIFLVQIAVLSDSDQGIHINFLYIGSQRVQQAYRYVFPLFDQGQQQMLRSGLLLSETCGLMVCFLQDSRGSGRISLSVLHCDTVLKRMNRKYDTARYFESVSLLRRWFPHCAVTTDLIVGFPGETEEEFEYLLDFLREARLDRVGCFSYSPVQGAKANALPDPVPEDVKEERRRRFMQVQSEISADNLKRRVGHVETVLIDSGNNGKGRAVGRSRYEAPDIDGLIYIDSDKPLYPGDLVRVRLTGSTEHDLTGVLNLTGGA